MQLHASTYRCQCGYICRLSKKKCLQAGKVLNNNRYRSTHTVHTHTQTHSHTKTHTQQTMNTHILPGIKTLLASVMLNNSVSLKDNSFNIQNPKHCSNLLHWSIISWTEVENFSELRVAPQGPDRSLQFTWLPDSSLIGWVAQCTNQEAVAVPCFLVRPDWRIEPARALGRREGERLKIKI